MELKLLNAQGAADGPAQRRPTGAHAAFEPPADRAAARAFRARPGVVGTKRRGHHPAR